jgi:hypothetical protein
MEWFQNRMKKGVPVDDIREDQNSPHPKALAMVNVEYFHTRWVNDVNAFLQAADAQVQDKFNLAIADWMPDAEREKDESKGGRWKPKGTAEGGWVIEIRGWTDYDDEVKGGRTFINRGLLRNLQRTDTFAQQTDGGKDGKESKVGKYIVGVPDPVKGRVSHAFVYNVFPAIYDPRPNEFYNINRGSFLDTLLDAGGGGGAGGSPRVGPGVGAGGPPGGTPGVADKPRTNGPGGGGPPAPGDAKDAPAAVLAPTWSGLGGTGGTAVPKGDTPPKKEDATRRRYEFVVMLVWREPTPSAPPPAAPTP